MNLWWLIKKPRFISLGEKIKTKEKAMQIQENLFNVKTNIGELKIALEEANDKLEKNTNMKTNKEEFPLSCSLCDLKLEKQHVRGQHLKLTSLSGIVLSQK